MLSEKFLESKIEIVEKFKKVIAMVQKYFFLKVCKYCTVIDKNNSKTFIDIRQYLDLTCRSTMFSPTRSTTSIDIKIVFTEFCNPDGCRNTPMLWSYLWFLSQQDSGKTDLASKVASKIDTSKELSVLCNTYQVINVSMLKQELTGKRASMMWYHMITKFLSFRY